MDKNEAAKAVGHIPSGLFVICAADGEQKDGYLASWVQQVSFDPLLISFTIKPGRAGYERIISGKVFTVNVVGEHDTSYLKHFWSGYAESPFGEIPHRISQNGGIIIDGAKSVIECEFVSKNQPGDHEVIIAKVIASHVNDADASPKVHIRKSGLDY